MARIAGTAKPASDPELGRLLQPAGQDLRRASVLSVAAGLLWPVQAAVVASALAGLLHPGTGPGPVVATVVFLAVGLARALLGYFSEGLLFTAGTRVVTEARAAIVARETRATEGAGAGAMAALAGEKLDMLLPYVTRYAPAQVRVMVLPLAILALAFWFSWAVGLILLMSGPLIPVFMALIGMAAKEASQRQMAEITTLNDLLVERLSALVDIRLLDAGTAVTSGFVTGADRLRERTMAVLKVAFLSSTVLELFSAIGVAMVAVYVGFDLLGAVDFGSYGTPLTPAAGIFLLLLAPDFYQPLRDLSAAWHDKAAALAVAGEMAIWHAQTPPLLLGAGARVPRLGGAAEISVRGLTAHRGAHLIRYPDLTLLPGESLAVTGPSGSGKTTLLRLLAGMLAPEAGQITVAGRALDAACADGWRARLGWMPQAPHFLDDTLAQNITFGGAGNLDATLRAAAVAGVVAALPGGLETRLGEAGDGLSGGEARRLTLARALHHAPDVLLADEPTADLDAETAEAVTAGLMALAARGCTLIIATHDADLAARMDRIIVLDGAA